MTANPNAGSDAGVSELMALAGNAHVVHAGEESVDHGQAGQRDATAVVAGCP